MKQIIVWWQLTRTDCTFEKSLVGLREFIFKNITLKHVSLPPTHFKIQLSIVIEIIVIEFKTRLDNDQHC